MNKSQSIKDYNVLIYNNNSLSIDDLKSLNLLYGPLMGGEALQIYLTFSSLSTTNKVNNVSFTHENIFDILGISERDFIFSRSKLEALGLLETYTDSSNYYYSILSPQRARSFIKGGVLGMYLNSKIGSTNLKKILASFKAVKPNLEELTNITKSFDEVFEIKDEYSANLKDVNILDDNNSKTINLKSSIDIEEVIDSIDTSYLKTSLDEFKKYLSNIEAVYKISKEELITIYNQSIVDNTFNKQIFSRKVKLVYEKNNNGNNIVFKTKESNNDIEKAFLNVSAQELLDKENLYTLKNVNLVSEIYNAIPYERVITNMMIYSVITKLHELPKVGYFEAMYNTMKEHNINTSLEAYDYLFTDVVLKDTTKKTVRRKSNIKENNPEWAKKANNDILKGFNKVEDDE